MTRTVVRVMLRAAVIAVPLLVWWSLAGRDTGVRVARTVDDESFIAAANDACRQVVPKVREARDRLERPEEDELIASVEESADAFAELVKQLRAIDVDAADRADVSSWLDDFDRYVALGGQYADALRSQDQERIQEVSERSDTVGRELHAFAVANDLDECRFE